MDWVLAIMALVLSSGAAVLVWALVFTIAIDELEPRVRRLIQRWMTRD